MTIALCFHCGKTKFGALCPCGECGGGASGNLNLDILFSDHRMPVASLEKFGSVIQRIEEVEQDPMVRFWAFIKYVSDHPTDLLKAEPPAEIAEQVRRALAAAQAPTIEVEVIGGGVSNGPPADEIDVPPRMLAAYLAVHPCEVIHTVQIRRRDGTVVVGALVVKVVGEPPQLIMDPSLELTTDDIGAIRKKPGWLLGWLFRPKWFE